VTGVYTASTSNLEFCRSGRFAIAAGEAANIECTIGDAAGGKGEDVRDEKISKFEVEAV